MTAYELIRESLKHLTIAELRDLKIDIERVFSKDSLAEDAWKKMNNEGKLHAVKHVKEVTGWGLKESKDYCDDLERASKNFSFERIFPCRGDSVN